MTVQPPRSGLILSVNAGSSSLKISLFRLLPSLASQPRGLKEPVELLLESSISNITAPPAIYSFKFAPAAPKKGHDAKKEHPKAITDHNTAFNYFLDYLKREAGIDRSQIVHICHRIVHGGYFFEPVVVNDESFASLKKTAALAPLHNGAALSVIGICLDAMPGANSIVFMDTCFHRTIPPHIAYYAIDQKIAKEKGLQKYGMHGLSYAYITRVVAGLLQKRPEDTNLLVMHLGSGASVCAIKNGKSYDTSMGLTPLEGLPGATRCGSVDPSLIFHYTDNAAEVVTDDSQVVKVKFSVGEEILNKRGGWKGITGTTDFGEIVRQMKAVEAKYKPGEKRDPEDEKWKLAFDIFADRVCNFAGSYFLKLEGKIDAIVFSGGIGEHSADLREVVLSRMACLGVQFDTQKNEDVDKYDGVMVEISKKEEGDKRIIVCRTDEQVEMAFQTATTDRFWLDQ